MKDGFGKFLAWASVFVMVLSVVGIFVYLQRQVVLDQGPILQFVSGTEYMPGEAGQIIVEARYINGSSALTTCDLLCWYPDKTVFLNMVGNVSSSGNIYVEFVVPNVTGVYEYQAQCNYTNGKNGIISKSFHVSEFQNDIYTKLNRIKAVMPK